MDQEPETLPDWQRPETMDYAIRAAVVAALCATPTAGAAAKRLRVGRSTLYRYLGLYGISPAEIQRPVPPPKPVPAPPPPPEPKQRGRLVMAPCGGLRMELAPCL